ncbi:hypothetical protein LP419_35120 [Massilia sp. H-1]|nr:hypothetical protein LP419_35120 [Massilia sp. H-1]
MALLALRPWRRRRPRWLRQARAAARFAIVWPRPGVDAAVRTMVTEFGRGGVVRDNVMVEYLNLYRADAPQYRPRLRELLLEQYRGQKIDLIIALRQLGCSTSRSTNCANWPPPRPCSRWTSPRPVPNAWASTP